MARTNQEFEKLIKQGLINKVNAWGCPVCKKNFNIDEDPQKIVDHTQIPVKINKKDEFILISTQFDLGQEYKAPVICDFIASGIDQETHNVIYKPSFLYARLTDLLIPLGDEGITCINDYGGLDCYCLQKDVYEKYQKENHEKGQEGFQLSLLEYFINEGIFKIISGKEANKIREMDTGEYIKSISKVFEPIEISAEEYLKYINSLK